MTNVVDCDFDDLAIGVLHANVGDREGHGPYAPCSLEDLRAARMDYWALGHIHQPEVLDHSPHTAYAGCPQGLDPTETGERGCWLVTLDERLGLKLGLEPDVLAFEIGEGRLARLGIRIEPRDLCFQFRERRLIGDGHRIGLQIGDLGIQGLDLGLEPVRFGSIRDGRDDLRLFFRDRKPVGAAIPLEIAD